MSPEPHHSSHLHKAEQFLKQDTQFHLGFLPTEQSHPCTRGLAETVQRDTAAGIRMLQSVDADIAMLADRLLTHSSEQREDRSAYAAREAAHPPGPERFHASGGPAAPTATGCARGSAFASLTSALGTALQQGRRICFSGCGATGRLSILLEACWRNGWRAIADQHPALAAVCTTQADRVCSIMTGGDYALVKSVENFEDVIAFGRAQVCDAGLTQGDVLVAISEGGETSSVIGTVCEALDRGVTAFFVFNNPAAILCQHIERSRRVIEDPRVSAIDLSTGPMAVAGSTRMQATTAELLVVGAALESAWIDQIQTHLPPAVVAALPATWQSLPDPQTCLHSLLNDLSHTNAIDAMAHWVDTEYHLYTRGGRITYFADECLLDIFTDTTERSPTFMLPPFRPYDDTTSPPPWAFVKDPLRPTAQAWQHVLGRPLRCLTWNAARYQAMNGPASTQSDPPRLDAEEVLKFTIGHETDPSRYATDDNIAMAIRFSDEIPSVPPDTWQATFMNVAAPFRQRLSVVIGPSGQNSSATTGQIHIPCQLPSTPLGLWRRLAAKLVLNTVSTATAGKVGRLTSNWMSHVAPSNKKLIDRGTRLIAELTGVSYTTACYALYETLDQQQREPPSTHERPSPVAATIARLEGSV